ncbi:MAG: hypothetical protein U1D35_01015, partial [Paracoccaceae bacterium]|nr:hypothetical protein [Paracoccaceae bacterium]
ISLAVAAAGWVGSSHPEITPPANFHHLHDTTKRSAQSYCIIGPTLSGHGLEVDPCLYKDGPKVIVNVSLGMVVIDDNRSGAGRGVIRAILDGV